MMHAALKTVRRFIVEDDGPTAVEYAVMLMILMLGCITAIAGLGNWLGGSYEDSSDKITTAMQ
jgi:pilus assembly protein Flp/PilA